VAGELKRLLAPLAPKAFVEQHFAKQAVHIRGRPSKFKGLFDEKAFWRALEAITAQGPQSRGLIRAHYDDRDRPPDVPEPFVRVDADGARRAIERRATLCVNSISEGDEKLKAFAAAVKRQLHWPGMARFNAYWSPDGRGLGMHFDARIACTLQIAGKKTWYFTRTPAVAWPRSNADRLDDGGADYLDPWAGHEAWEIARPTPPQDFEQVTLQPGDVFVLPAGCWHACAAAGESLALNLAMDAVTPLTLLCEALDAQLRSDEGWRVAPPTADGGRFLGQRAKALRKALDRIDARLLAQAWKARVES
jgi:ribosomal protein L16 Arg81 hydroxylase